MTKGIVFFVFFMLNLFSSAYSYSTDSPIGFWQTNTDIHSKDAGTIQVFQQNGILYGKIVRSCLNSTLKLCQHCPGRFKNKPVMGMIFMWGFTPHGHNNWDHGKVIDPRDGKIYHATMKLEDHGTKLQFRGYWFIFWDTQTWTRIA